MPQTKTTSDLRVTNQKTNEILIMGPIGPGGVTAQAVTEALATTSDPVLVTINSNGGDVNEGLAIANALRAHEPGVTTHIVGTAFSMASAIAVAGHTRRMAANALFMLHAPRLTIENKTSEELVVLAEMVRKRNEALLDLYTTAAEGVTAREEIAEMMAVTPGTFLTAEEAKSIGFIHEITNSQSIAASVDGYTEADLPARLRNTFKSIFSHEPDATGEVAPQSEVLPMSTASSSKATPEPKDLPPVTSSQIREACPGASAEFVLEQLDANLDMSAIQSNYAAKQANEIKRLTDELEKAQLAAKSEAPDPIRAALDDVEIEEFADGDDPIAAYNATCQQIATKQQIPINEARAVVKRKYPQLNAAYVDAFNANSAASSN